MEKEKFSLKDHLFNKEKVKYLSQLIQDVYEDFDSQSFEKKVLDKFPELELKERISWMTQQLHEHLLEDYKDSLNILLQALPKPSEKEDFIFSPFSDFVAQYGLDKKHLSTSLDALGECTKIFSAEFSIRDFLNTFPEETLSKMKEWSQSTNARQRRLASEGLRPKLPWASNIILTYKQGSETLDNLFSDTERYVTRSVANHLNDISKIDADFVLEKLSKWKSSSKQKSDEMEYIINHSLRTLIKKGHKEALEFIGYHSNPKIKIQNLKIIKDTIQIGDTLEFSFDIIALKNEGLLIDYKVTYPSPQKKISTKVFKLKKIELQKGEKMHIKKRHPFRKMTTKKLYSGEYLLEIQVNGTIFESIQFNIEV